MGATRYEITVDVPVEQAWNAIADFGGISRMNATVPRSHSTSDHATGVGATRHCDLVLPGASIEERVLDWHEGESYTVEIYDGVKAPPFRTNRATVAVRPDGDGRTVVSAELVYELTYGAAGRLMDRLMVEPKFGPAFKRLPASIAHHLETGDEVTEHTDLTAALDRVREVGAAMGR